MSRKALFIGFPWAWAPKDHAHGWDLGSCQSASQELCMSYGVSETRGYWNRSSNLRDASVSPIHVAVQTIL